MLERHIASQKAKAVPDPLVELERLVASEPNELAECFDRAVRTVFGMASASLLERDGDRLKVIATSGWASDARWRRELAGASDFYNAVVVEGRALTVLDPEDERELAGEGLLALPIHSPNADTVLGVIKIEQIEPAMLSDETPARLAVISRLLVPALASRPAARLSPRLASVAQSPLGSAALATSAGSPKRSSPMVSMWRRLRWLPPANDPADEAAAPVEPSAAPGSRGAT